MGLFTSAEVRFHATGLPAVVDAGKKAAAAVDEPGKAAARSGAAAAKSEGAWKQFSGAMSKVGDGAGKLTFALQGVQSIIGGVTGAGIVGAFGPLLTAAKSVYDVFSGAADRTRRLEQETRDYAAAMEHATEVAEKYGAAVRNALSAKAGSLGVGVGALSYGEIQTATSAGIGAQSAEFGTQAAFEKVEKARAAMERIRASRTPGTSAGAAAAYEQSVAEAQAEFDRAEKDYDRYTLEHNLPTTDTRRKAGGGGGGRAPSGPGGPDWEGRGNYAAYGGEFQAGLDARSREGANAMHSVAGDDYMAAAEAQKAILDDLDAEEDKAWQRKIEREEGIREEYEKTAAAYEDGVIGAVGSTTSAFAEAAIAAIQFGNNFGKSLANAAKSIAKFNLLKGIEQLAMGIAATVMLNPAAAGHYASAKLHFGVAAAAGIAAGAGGAFGGGGGGGGGGGMPGGDRTDRRAIDGGRREDERGGSVTNVFNVNGLLGEREAGATLIDLLNRAANVRGAPRLVLNGR